MKLSWIIATLLPLLSGTSFSQLNIIFSFKISTCESALVQYDKGDSEAGSARFVRASLHALSAMEASSRIEVDGATGDAEVAETFGAMLDPVIAALTASLSSQLQEQAASSLTTLETYHIHALDDNRVAIETIVDTKTSLTTNFEEAMADPEVLAKMPTNLQEIMTQADVDPVSTNKMEIVGAKAVYRGTFTKGNAADFREGRAFEISWDIGSGKESDNSPGLIRDAIKTQEIALEFDVKYESKTVRITRDDSGVVTLHKPGYTLVLTHRMEL